MELLAAYQKLSRASQPVELKHMVGRDLFAISICQAHQQCPHVYRRGMTIQPFRFVFHELDPDKRYSQRCVKSSGNRTHPATVKHQHSMRKGIDS